MALNRDDQERIRGYLLGQLSDDEQRKIEERLMIEDDLFEELEISKDEVIENYCAGELTPKEREWLEQHFLASPEGKLRRSFALALNKAPRKLVKPPTPIPLTLVERFQSLWRTQPFAVAAAASVFVVALIAIAYYVILPGRPSSVAVTLINATATRGENSTESSPPTRVILPPGADEVRISLILPASSTPGANYRAELVDEIQSLPIAARDTNSISVVIPAAQLRRDSYAIRLYAIKADGTEERIPGSYFFNVE